METNDLIKKLSQNHKKVETLESVWGQFFKWLLICLFCLAAGISTLGLREDWTQLFHDPFLALQNFFLLLSFICVGFSTLLLARPGQVSFKGRIFILVLPLVCWLIVLLLMLQVRGYNSYLAFKMSLGCIKDILVIGILPGVTLFYFLLQGIILNRLLSSLVVSFALLFIGAWATQFTCHNDDPMHILLWHFAPILVCAVLGTFIFSKIKKS